MTRNILLGQAFGKTFAKQARIITPNFQAARSLRVGATTLEDLAIERLEEKGLKPAGSVESRRALKKAVSKAMPGVDTIGTARAFSRTLGQLFRSGVNLEILACSEQPRIAALARLGMVYNQILNSEGLIDGEAVLWEAVRLGLSAIPLHVTGYPRLGKDGVVFLNAIAGDGSVLFLPVGRELAFGENCEAVEFLRTRGWEVHEASFTECRLGELAVDHYLGRTSQPVPLVALAFADVETEVRGILSQVKLLMHQGVKAKEIVLVTADIERYATVVLAVAWEYDLPVSIRHEVSLAQTRLGDWLSRLIEALANDFSSQQTGELLAHPYSRKFQSIDVATQTECLAPWPTEDRCAGWIDRLMQLMERFDLADQTANQAREAIAWRKFTTQILEQDRNALLDRQQFLEEVQEIIELIKVPFHPVSGGVELHPPFSVFGTQFDHLFFLGVVEGSVPASVDDDPVLDFHERRILKQQGFAIEDAVAVAARSELTLVSVLTAAQKQLVLSYPQIIDREIVEPSLLFDRLNTPPQRSQEQFAASLEELRRTTLTSDALEPAHHSLQVELARESTQLADEYDGVTQLPLDPNSWQFSSNSLKDLGQCPFRFFARRVLKLKAPDQIEDSLSNLLKGSFYHLVIELLLKPFLRRKVSKKELLERFTESFTQAEQEMEMAKVKNWPQIRSELYSELLNAVSSSVFLHPDKQVWTVEAKFPLVYWRGLKVSGCIDRVDIDAAGAHIFDYKSGTSTVGVQGSSGNLDLEIQLAIYLEAGLPELHLEQQGSSARYYFLASCEEKLIRPNDLELENFVMGVREHLELGSFPVTPDIKKAACKYCEIKPLCRVSSRIDRKGGNA